MKFEIRVNGRLSIEMQPETEIEALVLKQMRDGADKGKVVTIGLNGTDGYLVSVEK